ncbi:hypothetical protein MVEN_01332200 [Mycena venus]|uniref:Uncharacterized protein n=1 Tax=Mycena venus TaxID=2733690 RepID=A0A8H6Y063_9AGAR|nr:hypothetical protein MVEN_01332200 [Mycena venus]
MPVPLDQDVFSRILSHIPDSKTIHTVLCALPKSHEFFSIALRRLCELPVYLDTWDPPAAAASNEVLDYLLGSYEGRGEGIAESLRHLVVAVEHNKYRWPVEPVVEEEEEEDEDEDEEEEEKEEQQVLDEEQEQEEQDVDELEVRVAEDEPEEHVDENEASPLAESIQASEPEEDIDVVAFHDRLPALFKKTRNLRSLDYHSYPGLLLSRESTELLAVYDGLRTFAIDTCLRETPWRGSRPWGDPECWDIEPFLSTLGPSLISLDLRHVSQTMLLTLASHGNIFAMYENLEHLKMDITEGVWDWDGQGSPQRGATEEYVFPSLCLPAVRRFELVVADLTISKARAGPLDLVDCTLLNDLSLDVRQCIGYCAITTLRLFEALSPADFSALSHLEIKDENHTINRQRLTWDLEGEYTFKLEGRFFCGLVQQFLPSLASLVSLWSTNVFFFLEKAVAELWDDSASTDFDSTLDKAAWRASLKAILSQLESLRAGFGAMDAAEVGLILSCCDPTKLRQFGFTWAWKKHGRDEPISPELLAHLSRFPKLTDVHILFPRPETQVSGAPDPTIDPRTVRDVAAIFKCNGSICRVGIANSVVWERQPLAMAIATADPGVLLVSDGSAAPNPEVPRFYHMAKYTRKGETPWVHDDNTTPVRPRRGEEIGQLRDLLKRILE